MKIAILTALAALLLGACQHSAAPAGAAGHVFRDCTACPELVVIPAGRFTMGSPPEEAGRMAAEGPLRQVTVRAFAMGKYDVTRAQWIEFATATSRPVVAGCEWAGFPRTEEDMARTSWRNLGFVQEDSHPIVCVSWNDAQDYLRWLSQRTGHTYRLPTEAEWEYAARAGTQTPYPWGASISHEQANYGAEKCCSELASGHDQWLFTSPVGSFPANAFGLHDMHGNAWQWVEDCYVETYDKVPLDGSAYTEPNCSRRPIRGGTWGDPPSFLRSAFRNYAPPPVPRWDPNRDYRSGGVGFRVVRVLD